MKVIPAHPHLEPFDATVVENGDGPNSCTIYPKDRGDAERNTEWLSAREGSYCSSAAMR